MKRSLFGTDGVRGTTGKPPMDQESVFRLAMAAARFAERHLSPSGARAVVLGRDTRTSGVDLASAASAGFARSGWKVWDAGVLPTPALALAVQEWRPGAGVMITASHNPPEFNGMKIFGPGGRKLTDAEESAIETLYDRIEGETLGDTDHSSPEPRNALALYTDHLTQLLKPGSLRGWKIVVDCAHGAATWTTPAVLSALGAEVFTTGVSPDGANINYRCGTEHPAAMARMVAEHGAHLGIAHDGDGDRLVMADETGSVLSGDEMLAILGFFGIRFGWLRHRTLAVTIMANLGLDEMMRAMGGGILRSPVGDRHVAELMRSRDLTLGGEPSGHFLFPETGPGGDGLAGALFILKILLKTGDPLSRLRGCFRPYPQQTAALRILEKPPLESLAGLQSAMRGISARFGPAVRILVRYSGTEPLLRFLVEGRDQELVEEIMGRLVDAASMDLPSVEG